MSDSQLVSLTDLKVIGEYDTPEAIVAKLQQMGDPDFLTEAKDKGIEEIWKPFNSVKSQPWAHATHQFGYLAPRQSEATEPQAIQHPSAITADPTLKNGRINIRLDRLRIHKYPGGGIHNILVAFAARNQVADSQESVSFSQTYRVPEGQVAGIAGYPVFIGLNASSQGVAFECSTVNVKNEADQAVLSALESSPFQTGLELLTTAQPAIAPFTTLTVGLVQALAQRHENVPVQKFYLGLDFEDAAMGIRLAEGNYLAVQVPDETTLDWNKWIYKPDLGAIVHKADDSPLEYNYLVFRVSRYGE
ncbi:MAG: hypothetical protein SW833_18650 [Cyanobacteriota bacterium]|nr:hypothetical protein [Cyanobacteriota bacterium]